MIEYTPYFVVINVIMIIQKGNITSDSITLSCCLSQWVLVDLNLGDTQLEAAHYLKTQKTFRIASPD